MTQDRLIWAEGERERKKSLRHKLAASQVTSQTFFHVARPQLSSPIIKIIIPISSSLWGSSSSPRTSPPSPTCCQWAGMAAWNPMFSQFSQFRSPPSVHFTLSRHCGSNFLWDFFQSSRLFAQMIFLPGPTYLRLLVKPLQTKTLSNEALGLFSISYLIHTTNICYIKIILKRISVSKLFGKETVLSCFSNLTSGHW